MSTRAAHVLIDAADPERLAEFWAAALEWELSPNEPDQADQVAVWPSGYRYPDLQQPDSAALPLVFAASAEPKTAKNRMHLDLASESAAHQAAVVRRLRRLGATLLDIGQGQVPWVVLADPEGNELCVLEPRPVYCGTGSIAAIVVDSADPAPMARFWSEATGWLPQHGGADLRALRAPADRTPTDHALADHARTDHARANRTPTRAPAGRGPYLELLRVPSAGIARSRVRLAVAPRPDDDYQAEVTRLIQAGAKSIEIGHGDLGWTELSDVEGNEFRVLTPR